MPQSPIFESFLQNRSRSGNNDLCTNLYGEHGDGPQGPAISFLTSRPGLTSPVVTVGVGPIRGEYVAANGVMYVVSGVEFYAVDTSYNATLLGTVGSSSGPVSMIDSPTQVLVVDGTGGWVWDYNFRTFTQVIPNSDTDDTGPNVAVYQDGFGIVTSAGTNQVYQSNYNDLSKFASSNGAGLGATANNAFVQGNPQDVVTMFDLKREVWIFKSSAVEVWINQGNPGFAFSALQGVYIPVGCVAAASVARLGESLIWLGSDEQGSGVVYMTHGYGASPVSTHAIAQQIQSFAVISDAIGYSYQSNMHYFYVLTFPTQGTTYCYDLVTKKWHQRLHFSNGSFGREIPNCYAFFNGQHLVGDYRNGNIYALSDSAYTDNGDAIKWLRSWSALPLSMPIGVPMSFDSLQILMETGITDTPSENPQLMLRWSDDSGYTWTGYFQVPIGAIGQTSWRALQNRLGSTKIGTGLDRVWEISGTDPLSIKIVGAEWTGGPA